METKAQEVWCDRKTIFGQQKLCLVVYYLLCLIIKKLEVTVSLMI